MGLDVNTEHGHHLRVRGFHQLGADLPQAGGNKSPVVGTTSVEIPRRGRLPAPSPSSTRARSLRSSTETMPTSGLGAGRLPVHSAPKGADSTRPTIAPGFHESGDGRRL